MKAIAILHLPNSFTKESIDKIVGELKEQGIDKDYYLLVVNDAHDSAYVTTHNEMPDPENTVRGIEIEFGNNGGTFIPPNKNYKFEKFQKETHEFYEKELRELMIMVENAEAKANKRVPSFEEFVEWTEERNARLKNMLATDKRRIHDFFTGKSYVIKTCPEVMEAWRRK
jgi:hypothetical protein